MKNKIITAFVIIIAIVMANVVFSFATNQSDLEEVRTQIDDTREEIEEVEEALTGALEEIQELNKKIYSYETEIENLDGEINGLEAEISVAQTNLEKAQADYDKQQDMLEKRLVALYEAGETSFLDVLVNSDSIVDFITNYYIVSEIAEYDNNLLEQMARNKTDIEVAKQALETSKEQIQALKQSKEATANALKNSQSIKQSYANDLTDEQKALEEKLEQLQAEQKQIERELSNAENTYSDKIANLGGTGVLQKPVDSDYITATMYYSSGSYHGALDYGVCEGTYVYAAEAGVVLHAGGSYSGYGNYTCIQHGNGLRTYYAHGNGVFYVSEGDTVEKGQLIMQSGNTGNSTGPHLHFEVRVYPYDWYYGGNDSRRDPRDYL